MVRIRRSGTSSLELDLEGTRRELTELRDAVLRFCKVKRPLLEVPVDREFDPAPYDRRLSGLRLVRTNRKVRVEVDGDRLLVTGSWSSWNCLRRIFSAMQGGDTTLFISTRSAWRIASRRIRRALFRR